MPPERTAKKIKPVKPTDLLLSEADFDHDQSAQTTRRSARVASMNRKSGPNAGESLATARSSAACTSSTQRKKNLPLHVKSGMEQRSSELHAPASTLSGMIEKESDEESNIFKTPTGKSRTVLGVHDEDGGEEHEIFATPLESLPKRSAKKASFSRPETTSEEKDENNAELGADDDEDLGPEEVEDEENRQAQEEEVEKEDSDDDAPPEEVVSSRTAQSSKQAALTAARLQAALEKRKRKERVERLLLQAQQRRAPKIDRFKALQEAPLETDEVAPPSFTDKRKLEVPSLLPAELLESDDEENELRVQPEPSTEPVTKKLKLDEVEKELARAAKPTPKVKVGQTVYKVLGKKQDPVIAPKASSQSIQQREAMRIRGRVQIKKRGFLVK